MTPLGRRQRRGPAAPIWLLWVWPGLTLAAYDSPTEFLPDNAAWNGLSQFVALARDTGVAVELVPDLDWTAVTPRSALWVLAPESLLDSRQLVGYLRQGGYALLGDEIGTLQRVFRHLGIELRRRVVRQVRRHLDNPQLPIAETIAGDHRLTSGLRRVVANHPAQLSSSLPTLIGFGSGRAQQLVVSAAVGRGAFVALSDPSVLINAMLQFEGNRTLAINLLRESRRRGCDRVILLTGFFRQRGSAALPDAGRAVGLREGWSRLNALLARINQQHLSGVAMTTGAVLLALMALGSLLLVLPRTRRDIDGSWGQVGSGQHVHQRCLPADHVALLLKEEIEETLTSRLALPSPVSALSQRWVLGRVRQVAGAAGVTACGRFFAAATGLPWDPDRRSGAPRWWSKRRGERKLGVMYERARELLAVLGERPLAAFPLPDEVHNNHAGKHDEETTDGRTVGV